MFFPVSMPISQQFLPSTTATTSTKFMARFSVGAEAVFNGDDLVDTLVASADGLAEFI